MNISSKIVLITTLVSFYCSTTPIEIHSFKEIPTYISTKRTLIIFDIDNTLLTPKTDLGSDQWFTHLVQEHIKSGLDKDTAIKRVLPLYYHVNFHIDLVTTEVCLSEDIKHITSLCDHALCLTVRSRPMATRTVEQFANNGLNVLAPEHPEYELAMASPCLYKNGIIFCGMNDKGDALLTFLDSINYQPEAIIFIDDKDKYIQSVEAAAQKRNIEFIGLRYAGCDHRVRSFNKDATEQELQEFLAAHPCNQDI